MPVFSKELTKTDVNVRLSFPMEALNVFRFPEGKDKMEFKVTDRVEKVWEFGLSKRNEARHSHPKPVLSSGWRAYVQAKRLKVNDRVILYDQKGNLATKTRFKIQAQRKVPKTIKLFKTEIEVGSKWVDIEELKPEAAAASILCANQSFDPKCLTHEIYK